MIIVTGATGQLGRLVIASLLQKVPASSIVAVVRNVEKAQDLVALGIAVRYADYNQPATWKSALVGAEKLLLISSSEVGQRTQQHRTVIDAAKQAGVKLLAYTSLLHADTSPLGLATEHQETEKYLRASGVPFVILRHGWYTENYTVSLGSAIAHGAIYGCAGEGLIASATRADYAKADAVVLTSANQAGKVYELAGDSAYTLSALAAEVSRQTGKSINYVNLSQGDYQAVLVKAGLPEGFAHLLADSDTGASQGALFDEGHQLSQLIGSVTTPLSVAVATVL
ncbi:SDR family oxidoreductase [Beggiatoa leptomitoformis]|uniref:NAD(P)H-binding protein n=1 Tax=Beggiatoa leptomitoformis TaxID=288004 RepID=A0A2N9YFU5_9GAMM|nr:SDR family oxidoreductase [Beggiatoa leptomitoformis]ALG68327.1 NAD(P)H-binding protein [Beggiatoa leptomitoformis]AUI69357.1 NAD(P)H-binding protein [Beggiatoa leptomitoformis]